jgi:hypothetical protein
MNFEFQSTRSNFEDMRLVGQLHASEYGVPARKKSVAVSGRWVMGKSLRRA